MILTRVLYNTRYYALGGYPTKRFFGNCRKYCNFKTIFYQIVMGYPYKVIIFQTSCRNVKGFLSKIVFNLIENRFQVKIFPASCRKYL